MDHDERRKLWGPDAAMYEITRFFKTGFIPAALRDVEGVETWVELHLRPLQKNMDALCEFLSHRRAKLPSQPIVTEAFPTAG